jgi:hypothetical protein
VGPDPKQLERPIWSALTTTHASFALGDDLARRYPPDISPMAAVRQVSEDPCLQSLTKLLAPGDVVGLFSTEQVPADRNLAVIAQKVVDQMVYERGEAAPISGVVVKLTPADVPDFKATPGFQRRDKPSAPSYDLSGRCEPLEILRSIEPLNILGAPAVALRHLLQRL